MVKDCFNFILSKPTMIQNSCQKILEFFFINHGNNQLSKVKNKINTINYKQIANYTMKNV